MKFMMVRFVLMHKKWTVLMALENSTFSFDAYNFFHLFVPYVTFSL